MPFANQPLNFILYFSPLVSFRSHLSIFCQYNLFFPPHLSILPTLSYLLPLLKSPITLAIISNTNENMYKQAKKKKKKTLGLHCVLPLFTLQTFLLKTMTQKVNNLSSQCSSTLISRTLNENDPQYILRIALMAQPYLDFDFPLLLWVYFFLF